MKLSTFQIVILISLIYGCIAPPVTKNKQEQNKEESQEDGLENYMEYHRYLREVVNALESDPEFKRKLEKADESDIRSGKIAHELEFVSHHVRTRLDEIKRTELDRLRMLTQRKNDLMENNSIDDPTHHHLDHSNKHTFEIEDLKKLIAKTTEDLAEADRKRREEFKQYELEKEYERQQKINHTAGEEREKLVKEFQEMEQKHKTHEKLHEPGHKQQLEEVWEEQDHMQQDFDPKTFFMLHDLDSNGLWDEAEVKALFIKELDKMYAAGAPEDDMRERAEEMERMRESVFAEVDTNKDGFIDYQEFIAQTKRNDFQQDNGWKGLDEQRQYTDEELQEYIRQHELYNFFGDVYNQYIQAAQQYPGHYGQMPPPGMGHPGQVPPGYYPPNGNQVPPGGYHPNDINSQGAMPPQGQFHPGQLPQAHINPQQLNHQQIPPQGNPQFSGGNRDTMPNLNTNEVYQQYQNQPNQQNYPNQHHPNSYPNQPQANIHQNQQNYPNQQHTNVHQNQPQNNIQQNQQQSNIQQNQQQSNNQQNQQKPNIQQNQQQPNSQINHPNIQQTNAPLENNQNKVQQNEGVPQVQSV